VEIDGDGKVDILSGSYSRHDPDMAGLFQVLRGAEDGTFRPAEVLDGSDGKPLIITVGDGEDVVEKICTRPTAVDLDGDGKLDIVSGNFRGTFAFFQGEGKGRFAPKSTWLEADGRPLEVQAHSDPFFVDWDGDGDLDMLSGSSAGGAVLFENRGSKTTPAFAAPVTLVAARGHGRADEDERFGDAHLTGPQSATRVWADDVDGDGRLDLLVGDQVTVVHLAAGVTEGEARPKLRAWREKQDKLFSSQTGEQTATQQQEFQKAYEELQKERKKVVRDEVTGFVWLLVQKQNGKASGDER
jgi:hypothetical protein